MRERLQVIGEQRAEEWRPLSSSAPVDAGCADQKVPELNYRPRCLLVPITAQAAQGSSAWGTA